MMAARGMLANPAMFLGHEATPMACVQDWVNTSLDLGSLFNCFHHHLVFMLEHVLPKEERRIFNALKTKAQVLDFLQENYNIVYVPGQSGLTLENDVIVCDKSSDHEKNSQGSFFMSTVQKYEAQDDILDSLGALYD